MDALTQAPQQVWIAAAFEQMLENAVVLAREADKQLGLVEEDSKVCAGCCWQGGERQGVVC